MNSGRKDPDTNTKNLRIIAGEWRIARRLGRGGTANVYLAVHVVDGRRAALKILRRELVGQKPLVRRFLREAELTAKIRHPGVIHIHGHGTVQDGRPYIVAELLEGETLDERRIASPQKRLDWQEVVSVGIRMLEALDVAHEKGVVHRDVKPTNVFVTTTGVVKLLDFGIAGLGEDSSVLENDNTRTALGIGTPLFMAPEQLTGDDAIDGRADLFGVAATLFHAMSGRVPFGTSSFSVGALIAAYAGGPADLRELVPAVPRQVARVITRALAMRPRERFASANDMKVALETALDAAASLKPVTRPQVWLDQTAPLPTVRRMAVASVHPPTTTPPSGEAPAASAARSSSNPAISAPVSSPPLTPANRLAQGYGSMPPADEMSALSRPPRPTSQRPHPGPPPPDLSNVMPPLQPAARPPTSMAVPFLIVALVLVVATVLAMRLR